MLQLDNYQMQPQINEPPCPYALPHYEKKRPLLLDEPLYLEVQQYLKAWQVSYSRAKLKATFLAAHYYSKIVMYVAAYFWVEKTFQLCRSHSSRH